MKKWRILPKMALKGIMANGMVYYPYIVAGIFSVFTFFVFSSISYNDITDVLPYAPYALVIMEMGRVLLGMILLLFLFYAGSFVMKRRKKEVGLYNLLGLEKTHIGMMLLFENMILYVVVAAGGILLGTVLAKLMFLILLKLSSLPMTISFTFSARAFYDTLLCLGVIFLINFARQVLEIGRSKGTELLSGTKKGEKEPKLLPVWSAAGAAVLILGYSASVNSQADSMILISFFLAVFLVIIGTYLMFTSGSVLLLKIMKRSKKMYYRKNAFITISGMYYRMKKNASGLSNICIFATMTLITLICTFTVCFGLDEVAAYVYPYDVTAEFRDDSLPAEAVQKEIFGLAGKHGVSIERMDIFDSITLTCSKEENRFGLFVDQHDAGKCRVIFMTLDAYNQLTDGQESLEGEDVLLYTNGRDFGYDSLDFMGIRMDLKKEVYVLFPYPKFESNPKGSDYIVIVKDEAQRDRYVRVWAEQNGVEDIDAFLRSGGQKAGVLLTGEENKKDAFIEDFMRLCEGKEGFVAGRNGLYSRRDLYSMYGSLLFIGVIFGLIFFMCLLIIMYYKQISEGYEDQASFTIMKKVGMSDTEIKGTIHRQIFCVFGTPLAGAVLHTLVGMFMVRNFMAIIDFYNGTLITVCMIGTIVLFGVIYSLAYFITAKTYYRIVNHSC